MSSSLNRHIPAGGVQLRQVSAARDTRGAHRGHRGRHAHEHVASCHGYQATIPLFFVFDLLSSPKPALQRQASVRISWSGKRASLIILMGCDESRNLQCLQSRFRNLGCLCRRCSPKRSRQRRGWHRSRTPHTRISRRRRLPLPTPARSRRQKQGRGYRRGGEENSDHGLSPFGPGRYGFGGCLFGGGRRITRACHAGRTSNWDGSSPPTTTLA